MLRGLALAILLVNLALLIWGSSRPGPRGALAPTAHEASTTDLPTLVLIDDLHHDAHHQEAERGAGAETGGETGEEAPGEWAESSAGLRRCLRFGPLSGEEAESLIERAASLNLTLRRSDGSEASLLEVMPGRDSGWPQRDLRALAEALAVEISPCRTADPIAPEASRP